MLWLWTNYLNYVVVPPNYLQCGGIGVDDSPHHRCRWLPFFSTSYRNICKVFQILYRFFLFQLKIWKITLLRKLSTIISAYFSLWFIGILLPRQIEWCVWFYPWSQQKRQKQLLFLKFTHCQVCNYRVGKTRFWCPSLFGERLGTQYRRIHNQHNSTNTLTPSLVSLGRINSLYFQGLSHPGNNICQ